MTVQKDLHMGSNIYTTMPLCHFSQEMAVPVLKHIQIKRRVHLLLMLAIKKWQRIKYCFRIAKDKFMPPVVYGKYVCWNYVLITLG